MLMVAGTAWDQLKKVSTLTSLLEFYGVSARTCERFFETVKLVILLG